MCEVKVRQNPNSKYIGLRTTFKLLYIMVVLDIHYNLKLLFKKLFFYILLCLRYVYSQKRSEITKQYESNKVHNTVFYIQKNEIYRNYPYKL